MQLLLLRHGEATNNVTPPEEARFGEHELTARGMAQVEQFCQHYNQEDRILDQRDAQLKGLLSKVDYAYSSPMLRALQTTRIVHQNLTLPPVEFHPSLMEWGGPVELDPEDQERKVRGLNDQQLQDQFPFLRLQAPEKLSNGWWDNQPKESPEEVWARGKELLDFFRSKHQPDEVVLVVSHLWFINVLRQHVLANDFNYGWWETDFISMNNAALSICEVVAPPSYQLAWNPV